MKWIYVFIIYAVMVWVHLSSRALLNFFFSLELLDENTDSMDLGRNTYTALERISFTYFSIYGNVSVNNAIFLCKLQLESSLLLVNCSSLL